jgi:1-deoxy-D-xylulose-5-phosphate reductoisomerase
VLNAANEVAVAAFLQRKCAFPAIWETVGSVMGEHRSIAGAGLDAILLADSWARQRAGELLGV